MHPDFETIWQRMRENAQLCKNEQRPIYTLQNQVKNYITDVRKKSIGRWSEEGRSNNQSRLNKGEAKQYWDYLCGNRTDYRVLYFIPAFMLDALPDLVEDVGNGHLRLKPSPTIVKPNNHLRLPPIPFKPPLQRPKTTTRPLPGHGGGGEGELHQSIKEAIYDRPNEILDGLSGGPFAPYKKEYSFSTGDRVDVALRDANGRIVLVEVKPVIAIDDKSPFAQAAKYRTLWHILESAHLDDIRVLVVAPEIPSRLGKEMLKQHKIESFEVNIDRIDE